LRKTILSDELKTEGSGGLNCWRVGGAKNELLPGAGSFRSTLQRFARQTVPGKAMCLSKCSKGKVGEFPGRGNGLTSMSFPEKFRRKKSSEMRAFGGRKRGIGCGGISRAGGDLKKGGGLKGGDNREGTEPLAKGHLNPTKNGSFREDVGRGSTRDIKQPRFRGCSKCSAKHEGKPWVKKKH